MLYYEKLRDAKLASEKWTTKQTDRNSESPKRFPEDDFMEPIDRRDSMMGENDEPDVEEISDDWRKSINVFSQKINLLPTSDFEKEIEKHNSLSKVDEESNDQSFISGSASPNKTPRAGGKSPSENEEHNYVNSSKNISSESLKVEEETIDFYKSTRRETTKNVRANDELLIHKLKHSHTVRLEKLIIDC